MKTNNYLETIEVGKKIAKNLKKGDIVALFGELGSGKTTLTKGIASGLGVKNPEYVNSPSFVLIREYKGKTNLYHLDLYRTEGFNDIATLGVNEYFYSDGVTVIEWAQKARDFMPKDYIAIKIDMLKGDEREITLNVLGERYKERKIL